MYNVSADLVRYVDKTGTQDKFVATYLANHFSPGKDSAREAIMSVHEAVVGNPVYCPESSDMSAVVVWRNGRYDPPTMIMVSDIRKLMEEEDETRKAFTPESLPNMFPCLGGEPEARATLQELKTVKGLYDDFSRHSSGTPACDAEECLSAAPGYVACLTTKDVPRAWCPFCLKHYCLECRREHDSETCTTDVKLPALTDILFHPESLMFVEKAENGRWYPILGKRRITTSSGVMVVVFRNGAPFIVGRFNPRRA
jgi:hypothetical protein